MSSSSKNDDAEYYAYADYVDKTAKQNNIKHTLWCIGNYKNPMDFSKPHGLTVQWVEDCPLEGDTWLDVWKCIDKAYEYCGYHCFIEEVSLSSDGKSLWVFMGS
jgi:hypothetical protein